MTTRAKRTCLYLLSASLAAMLAALFTTGLARADDPLDMDWLVPSLALDSQGSPHTSFWAKNVGNDLRYASWDAVEGQWHDEVADAVGQVGRYSSLVIDAAGRPHISYYDLANANLRYAFWDGTAWITHVLDSAGDVGNHYTSLALDAAGSPRISYYDATNGNLKLAWWNPATGSWATQAVDEAGDVGAFSSLRVDAAGDLLVSYSAFTQHTLKVARGRWTGAAWTWTFQTVEKLGARPEFTSLALDAAGQPRVAYYDLANGDLKYAAWNAQAARWQVQVVDGRGDDDAGRFTSLVMDAAGRPHITYHHTTSDRLRYAHWDGTQWLIDIVDVVRPMGTSSLELSADGRPLVAYADRDSFDLRYAFWDPDQQDWVHQIVFSEEEAGVGYYNSLELDPGLGAHISYYDKTDRDLKYAHRYWDGAGWTWDVQVLDPAGRTGRYTSLELDHSGHPRISYLDSEELELSYAVRDDAGWTITAVPNDYGMGRFGSMALDVGDNPHFASFAQDPYGGLAYAHWDGAGWRSELVDPEEDAGWSTSIAVDNAGHPHISYTEEGDGVLRYAHWDGAQWLVQTVASIGRSGQGHRMGTSLALDSAGRPHIGFYEASAGDLKYARWDGASWMVQTVDVSGDVGSRPSLRLDGDGHPHLGYYDKGYGAVKYAAWDGASWQVQVVDAQDNPGWHLSLALEPTAPYAPHLSYMTYTTGVLKYAYWSAGQWQVELVDDGRPTPIQILTLESDTPAAVSRPIEFTAAISGTGPILYTWDFGGPGTRGGSDARPTFAYDLTGTYTVTLTVANDYPSTDVRSVSVVVGPDVGDHLSLALDGRGRPQVSYRDLTEDRLMVARWDGAAWQAQVADPEVGRGPGSALALDASGLGHVSYLATSKRLLSYAHWTGDKWILQAVDRADPRFPSTAIALDSRGYPTVCYVGDLTDWLKCAQWSGTRWTSEFVDRSVVTGGAISLRLNRAGQPCVSYYDQRHGDLRFACRSPLGWVVQTVDSAGDVGKVTTSLVLDALGLPHISYYDATQGTLRYADRGEQGWQLQTVDGSGHAGSYSTLALDAAGRPRIAYYDDGSRVLKYAAWDGQQWVVQTVDCEGDVGRYASLALDPEGHPHIGYRDETEGALKIAEWDGSQWLIQLVDGAGW